MGALACVAISVAQPANAADTTLSVRIASSEITAEEGTSISPSYSVSGGTEPYTAAWTNGRHEATTLPLTATECDDYILTITDANGKTAADTVRIYVTGTAHTATFENLYLDSEGYWTGFNMPNKFESFVSGSYLFENFATTEYGGYWGNFGYSNRTATTFSMDNYVADQFNVVTAGGRGNGGNFVVAYPQGGSIEVMNNDQGDKIAGFYITNTAWVESAILNGDGMSGTTSYGEPYAAGDGFRKGDYLYVDVIGVHDDDTKDTVRVYLADYRSDDDAAHYYIKQWQWVDLSTLGTVETITFRMASSRANDWGMTTPAYFAMDDFNGTPDATAAVSNTPAAKADATETARYTLDGKRISTPQRGINIVRMSDGTTKKVLNK